MASAVVAVALMAAAVATPAQKVKDRASNLDDLAFTKPELRAPADYAPFADGAQGASMGASEVLRGVQPFVAGEGAGWRVTVDRAWGGAALLEGPGIPWLPGTASGLSGAEMGLAPSTDSSKVPLKVATDKAMVFLRTYPDLFAARPDELRVREGASGPIGDSLYTVDFAWVVGGVTVENAHVVFRINHGNLVQVGQEYVSPAIRRLDTSPSLTPETAWQIVWGYIGGRAASDRERSPASLVILPVADSTVMPREGVLTTSLGYRLAFSLTFKREGVMGTWESLVDAHTGEILAFRDANVYGSVHGGVFAGDQPSPEVDRPFPFADVGTSTYADAGGLFPGDNATSTLKGKYVKIVDTCGAIALSTTDGDLDFGSGTGTDCETPGVGGPGNTHAARTQYYHVNLIKMKAMNYLPDNAWLKGQVTDNVNLNQTCNAYWDGQALNFFKSGGGCNNTGELPGVSLHEWGHGMDSNDGNGSSPDKGTGETYGDFTAALQTHSSCVGNGFSSSKCGGYGNPCTDCSGIRDMDWEKHQSKIAAKPSQLNGTSGFRCSQSASYAGPCGYEGHCESYISTEALWDLATKDLPDAGLDAATAWQLVDRLWYTTRKTATAAYACPSLSGANGCGAGSLFTVFRFADDCDGNLTNGTPHAAEIYAAFSRHGIGCDTVTNTDQTDCCPAIEPPVVAAVPGNNTVALTWDDVPGAQNYDVFRNESGCDAGYTRIARVTAPQAAHTDITVVNGLAYAYRVQAVGASDSCTSPMSECITTIPQSCAGAVRFTEATYTCDDEATIVLADSDLTGAGTAVVAVSSTLEPTPESVTLTESPAQSGRFSGTIRTATSSSPGDGAVAVIEGTILTVRYVDASACGPSGIVVEATATADCTAPAITSIQVVPYGTGARISWHTDESTTGRLFYGTTTLSHTLSETAAATDHALVVSGLSSCTDHIFAVEATDAAGNTTRADNAGANYAFTTSGLDTSGQASTDVPKAIPDYSSTGVYSVLAVDSPYTVAGVTVTVNVRHPWVGDVALTLVHPDGQTWVRLAEKEGGSGDGYWNTTFDDEAGTAIYEAQPPFTGTFRPETPLAKFAGMPAGGTWRLYAHDLGRDDVGTLLNWSMTLTLDVPCSADFKAHASADPVSAFVPVTVTFSASAENGTPPYTYAWNFGDGLTGTGPNPSHAYTTGGSYTITLTATDAASHTAVHTLAVNASSTVEPPAIGSVTKKGNPFRLDISGSNFHSACEVRIDGVPAPQTKYKSATRVLAKGGGSLKAMVPKGQTVLITVVNTDDGGASAPFPFSW